MPLCYSAIPSRSLRRDGADLKGFGISQQAFCNAKIDPEFSAQILPLSFEELQQLEQNIIAEGRLLNPIITWNGYILDGHTRYRILKKHGFIKFEVEEIQLANKYEALAWICKNQLGRRNLSPEWSCPSNALRTPLCGAMADHMCREPRIAPLGRCA